jgi:formate hydrogenlyase subunit 3/multisubunit Na+/H+ antiporter MnhD subunit
LKHTQPHPNSTIHGGEKALSKDQTIGGAILAACLIIAIFYVATLFIPEWLGILGLKAAETDVRFWIIAAPVFVAFVAIMVIGAWIGWTMAKTPPPKPIEETTNENPQETTKKNQSE